ncbi:unnamed protein product [Soboliphyme baturini]|uniref:Uncharacterized protein n=1 Tax=Soboliphyme baturini TaxID=241478 RepID=A0A183IXE4_9BILA|nr:unnamed protein product [Soboliphyme baturini]
MLVHRQHLIQKEDHIEVDIDRTQCSDEVRERLYPIRQAPPHPAPPFNTGGDHNAVRTRQTFDEKVQMTNRRQLPKVFDEAVLQARVYSKD